MTTTAPRITPDMTMEQILEVAPAAQRALFQRYHVGGCSSCGFQPTDTLAQVCKERNILDINEVIDTIQRAQDLDTKVEVSRARSRAGSTRARTSPLLMCGRRRNWSSLASRRPSPWISPTPAST